jgi:hypothetical protein
MDARHGRVCVCMCDCVRKAMDLGSVEGYRHLQSAMLWNPEGWIDGSMDASVLPCVRWMQAMDALRHEITSPLSVCDACVRGWMRVWIRMIDPYDGCER